MSWSTVGTLAGPALAALVGAWVGARFALRRFKKERAYEHRIDWYRDTLRAANEATQRYQLGAKMYRRGLTDDAMEEIDKASQAADLAMHRSQEAALFARPETVKAIEENDWSGYPSSADFQPDRDDPARRLDEIAEVYRTLRAIVARDGRKVMQAEELKG